MSCNTCANICPVYSCYSNLFVGKVANLNTDVLVVIENVATGRVVSEVVTTNGSGVIILTGGTWDKMLYTSAQIKIKVMLSGEQLAITPYATSTTFGTTTYDCLIFETSPLYDEDGDMYAIPNQYLIEA